MWHRADISVVPLSQVYVDVLKQYIKLNNLTYDKSGDFYKIFESTKAIIVLGQNGEHIFLSIHKDSEQVVDKPFTKKTVKAIHDLFTVLNDHYGAA